MKPLLITALVAASLAVPATAQADYVPVCTQSMFLYGLRVSTRTICDAQIRPDGSWMRARGFYAPGYYKSWCGAYSCTMYPIPPLDIGPEVYLVTPDTILPDEPGHLG